MHKRTPYENRVSEIESGLALESRPLPFERLDVYNVAIDLIEIVGGLPTSRGCANPMDHLKRAATSVALNVAEACGKSGADRKRFFAIARGSALEAAAALRILYALRGIEIAKYNTSRSYCERLYAMLTKLCR